MKKIIKKTTTIIHKMRCGLEIVRAAVQRWLTSDCRHGKRSRGGGGTHSLNPPPYLSATDTSAPTSFLVRVRLIFLISSRYSCMTSRISKSFIQNTSRGIFIITIHNRLSANNQWEKERCEENWQQNRKKSSRLINITSNYFENCFRWFSVKKPWETSGKFLFLWIMEGARDGRRKKKDSRLVSYYE